MWRKILPISKDPFLSKMSFHFILTNCVTGSCAQRSSAELIRNLLVRDYRWASCLANAGLVVSWDFIMCIKANHLLFLNKHCVYHLWLEIITITFEFITVTNVKNIESRAWKFEGKKKTKRGNRFVLLIWISILIKITGSICNRIWSHK